LHGIVKVVGVKHDGGVGPRQQVIDPPPVCLQVALPVVGAQVCFDGKLLEARIPAIPIPVEEVNE
jgi:hypothetical protein